LEIKHRYRPDGEHIGGEPDDSGRRGPETIKGTEFDTPSSVAIIAAGTPANPLIQTSTPG
jgi:glutamate synthase (NADPH/NADH) small chain